jgi:hypothetical protein
MSKISLVNVAKYYQAYPHQDEALKYLESQSDPATLTEFAKLWRKKPEQLSIKDKIQNRLNELGIQLDPGLTLIGLEGCNPDFTLNSDSFFEDAFNDLVLLVDQDINILTKQACTTEPGRYYTKNRLNPAGAARLEIDYKHNDCWMLGKHKNQYPCLIQIGNKVRVRRDGNEDGKRTGDAVQEGWFGINFHHGSGSGKIGKWSAGCVVIDNPSDHKAFMKVLLDNKKDQTKFSFVLLDSSKSL